jgi:putative endonuclease
MYYVYVLRSEVNNRFYIGATKDISLRLARHNAGHSPSTKAYRPWKLVFSQAFDTFSDACKRETEIKHWKNTDFMAEQLGIEK